MGKAENPPQPSCGHSQLLLIPGLVALGQTSLQAESSGPGLGVCIGLGRVEGPPQPLLLFQLSALSALPEAEPLQDLVSWEGRCLC